SPSHPLSSAYLPDVVTPVYLPLSLFSYTPTPPPAPSPLPLHDALPICRARPSRSGSWSRACCCRRRRTARPARRSPPNSRCRRRSEEHTSELQSLTNLVCRLLLEKKKHDSM